jgi:hypothetical protein
MAPGQLNILDRALVKIGNEINLGSTDFRVVLAQQDQLINPAFSGASGNAVYADLTHEITGSGYVAKGEVLANTNWALSAGVASFTADTTLWVGLTATMKYALIVKDVAGTLSDILAFFDLELTDPAGRSSSGGDFVITWPGGLFTLTRA